MKRSVGQGLRPGIGAAGAVLLVSVLTLGYAGEAPKDARATLDTPLPRPGMGWTTYNFFRPRHDDRLMKEMGKAFVDSGLRDAGYTILRIDGGWWGDDGNRREWYWTEDGQYHGDLPYKAGDPHVDPKNYPGGMRPLADHLHKQGLKLGFYLSPALSMGKADNYPGNKNVKVPPPVTGSALVEQHARWVTDNGIDHLFYDGYDWNRSQGTEPYSRMYGWLRREAKRVDRPIAFSINTGWLGREREWADEWRTSQDINGQWQTILECIATVADPKPGGHGRWNNPDCVMVGFLPDAEAKLQMSVRGLAPSRIEFSLFNELWGFLFLYLKTPVKFRRRAHPHSAGEAVGI